mmetsp:Transcript_33877/g.100632  ORF Transcript_33877/g.100632 Transcript_33877/m.100632 type:complete len:253 (+) Transcript_33877:363-1121(+)
MVVSRLSTCSSVFSRSRSRAWCCSFGSLKRRHRSLEFLRNTRLASPQVQRSALMMDFRTEALSVSTRMDLPGTMRPKDLRILCAFTTSGSLSFGGSRVWPPRLPAGSACVLLSDWAWRSCAALLGLKLRCELAAEPPAWSRGSTGTEEDLLKLVAYIVEAPFVDDAFVVEKNVPSAEGACAIALSAATAAASGPGAAGCRTGRGGTTVNSSTSVRLKKTPPPSSASPWPLEPASAASSSPSSSYSRKGASEP